MWYIVHTTRKAHKKRAIRLSRHQIALSPVKSKLHYITSLSIFSFLSQLWISTSQWTCPPLTDCFIMINSVKRDYCLAYSIGLTSCSYLTKEDFLFCFFSSFVVFIVLHFKHFVNTFSAYFLYYFKLSVNYVLSCYFVYIYKVT